ncbi:unnamed protein product [Symbiodinium natans]|uniref:Ubiquitin-like domain-containing protein n=1 Tax=Symbiodinium natans TaxID=878477 RepID=A0A812KE98_9DINO|nr:unnamed protein product [Symbiodinium natans]
MALKVVQLSGQTVAADLKGVQSVSELRQRVGAAVGEAPARIRLLAGEIEVMDSSDFVPAAFPSGVVTMAISAPGLQAGFYYLDDCEAFNYDSDVDGGEDEIEILEDGSAKRELLHRRSWIDGGGHSGNNVRHARGEGTWELDDKNRLRVTWTRPASHKGQQPSEFSLTSEGSLMYPCPFRQRQYRYFTTRQMKAT